MVVRAVVGMVVGGEETHYECEWLEEIGIEVLILNVMSNRSFIQSPSGIRLQKLRSVLRFVARRRAGLGE